MNKDYILLVDGTKVTIEEGGCVASITHIAVDLTDATEIFQKIKEENISTIKFYKDGATDPYGSYDHLAIEEYPTISIDRNNVITVHFGFREKTETEIRLDANESALDALTAVMLTQGV